jgi:hypothetical protein
MAMALSEAARAAIEKFRVERGRIAGAGSSTGTGTKATDARCFLPFLWR